MRFKNFITEIAQPQPPSTKIKRSNIVKNRGTFRETPVVQFQFTTKLGNVVKVHLQDKGDKTWDVVFYVNDTLDDNASKADSTRDPEILSGVLHIIQTKMDQFKANNFTFSAHSGQGDNQTVKNLEIQPYLQKLLNSLNQFEQTLKSFPVTMIPPSQSRIDLFKRLNRGTPEPLPNVDTKALLAATQHLKSNLQGPSIEQEINQFLEQLLRVDWKLHNLSFQKLVQALREYETAVLSHRPDGVISTHNRRQNVYEKLMQRHFSGIWNISVNGASFRLSRKQPLEDQ